MTADRPPGDDDKGDRPPAGFGDPTCPHEERVEGVCTRCGHCVHDVVLNGACMYCNTTELDPVAMSPKKSMAVIPASALLRKKP